MKLEPLKFGKEERIKLGSDISEIWFYEYLNLCYSDKDLEDAKEELKKIRLEMRDFALFCIERFIKRKVKSACEFFLLYAENPSLLLEEHPEYIPKNSFRENPEWPSIFPTFVCGLPKYHKWLFKLAFVGVFTKEKECD